MFRYGYISSLQGLTGQVSVLIAFFAFVTLGHGPFCGCSRTGNHLQPVTSRTQDLKTHFLDRIQSGLTVSFNPHLPDSRWRWRLAWEPVLHHCQSISCSSLVHWPSCPLNACIQCLILKTNQTKADTNATQMYRRGTLLCADPAIGLIRAHTLHRQQSSPEVPNPALELPGIPASILCYFFTLYWDILPNWLGFPNMNLRESPGHTSMDLSYSHLPDCLVTMCQQCVLFPLQKRTEMR